MLNEVSVKPKYKKKFETWFEEFKSFLDGLATGKQVQVILRGLNNLLKF